MDNFQWRGRAKGVAYVDLILTSIYLLVVIGLVVLAGAFTAVATNPEMLNNVRGPDSSRVTIDEKTKDTFLAVGAWIIWIAVGIATIVTVIQLWAAIQLMNATELGREPTDALKKAGTWRNVTVTLLIISAIGSLLSGLYIILVIELLIRGIFLYVVYNFIEELNVRQYPGPTVVTVMSKQ